MEPCCAVCCETAQTAAACRVPGQALPARRRRAAQLGRLQPQQPNLLAAGTAARCPGPGGWVGGVGGMGGNAAPMAGVPLICHSLAGSFWPFAGPIQGLSSVNGCSGHPVHWIHPATRGGLQSEEDLAQEHHPHLHCVRLPDRRPPTFGTNSTIIATSCARIVSKVAARTSAETVESAARTVIQVIAADSTWRVTRADLSPYLCPWLSAAGPPTRDLPSPLHTSPLQMMYNPLSATIILELVSRGDTWCFILGWAVGPSWCVQELIAVTACSWDQRVGCPNTPRWSHVACRPLAMRCCGSSFCVNFFSFFLGKCILLTGRRRVRLGTRKNTSVQLSRERNRFKTETG